MTKKKALLLTVLMSISFFTQCERDDICLEGTSGTPRLIIRFFDHETPTLSKIPEGLYIRAIDNTFTLTNNSSDSLGLPLNSYEPFTAFEFISNFDSDNEIIDTLQFNYSREDLYINRACGFKGRFIFSTQGVGITESENNWIKGYTIIKDTIADETNYHLAILH